MALDYNNIQTMVREKHIPVLVDNIFNKSYRLKKTRENPLHSINTGNGFMIPLLHDKGRGGVYAERQTLNINPKQNRTKADYDWKYAYSSINISKQDEDQITGDEAILNLMNTEMEIAEKTLMDNLSTYSYNDGLNTLEPHGQRKIVSYDRTLGGINSTTETWWDANHSVVVDSNYTTTNLSETNLIDPSSAYYLPTVMNKVWMDCIHGGEKPTAVYASKGMYRLYERTGQPFQQFQNNFTSQKIIEQMADMGFQALSYHGVPIIYDEFCPAGHIYFDNHKYNGLVINTNDNFKLDDFIQPANAKYKVATITVTCQFATSNARMLGSVNADTTIG